MYCIPDFICCFVIPHVVCTTSVHVVCGCDTISTLLRHPHVMHTSHVLVMTHQHVMRAGHDVQNMSTWRQQQFIYNKRSPVNHMWCYTYSLFGDEG